MAGQSRPGVVAPPGSPQFQIAQIGAKQPGELTRNQSTEPGTEGASHTPGGRLVRLTLGAQSLPIAHRNKTWEDQQALTKTKKKG